MDFNQHNPRVDTSRFSMIPRADIPRSKFITRHAHKTTFDASYLIPILVKEIIPGDVIKGSAQFFARLATLLFPLMDRLVFESFFFFVPNRLLWANWVKMMGERLSPGDSISYITPQIVSPVGGFSTYTLFDYMGVPTTGQTGAGNTISVNALPFRAYGLIHHEWFRDENLQGASFTQAGNTGDGPDLYTAWVINRRNKRPDYFTSALPWPLKGGVDVTLPLAGQAPVQGIAVTTGAATTAGTPASSLQTYGGAPTGWTGYWSTNAAGIAIRSGSTVAGGTPQIYADLSQATGATINALRLAFQTQRLLERDARSGTRYTELLRAHFGVTPEDQRLQRPEYVGGGRTDFNTQAIPQTSATGLTGGSTALGSLGAASTVNDQHTFSLHATEHGWLMGLVNVRAELTYQQGLHRKWTRSTRYDYYWPVFAHLGEQAVLNRELYSKGDANDALTFGYQERWAEYRYEPSMVTGAFRSTTAVNVDEWHLAEQFSSLPALNNAFIQDSTRETLSRVLAAGASAYNQQILLDSLFTIEATRPLPMYSEPGMVDRF